MPAHAEALGRAWRDYPDLPPSSQIATRAAARVIAIRLVFEEMRLEAEAERRATNIAFTENKSERTRLAILNGRNRAST
ncbi:hypothetical protein ACMGDM_16710 [Sphingomonas sp. DT-51]|uniref:hypothetical protein n=1 Tax=Sphingomonas sp. DT-51 TaxID=3396165 RepID=UPI003F1B450B